MTIEEFAKKYDISTRMKNGLKMAKIINRTEDSIFQIEPEWLLRIRGIGRKTYNQYKKLRSEAAGGVTTILKCIDFDYENKNVYVDFYRDGNLLRTVIDFADVPNNLINDAEVLKLLSKFDDNTKAIGA